MVAAQTPLLDRLAQLREFGFLTVGRECILVDYYGREVVPAEWCKVAKLPVSIPVLLVALQLSGRFQDFWRRRSSHFRP
jgi:hypothetical protein